jgi:hypothetical protein
VSNEDERSAIERLHYDYAWAIDHLVDGPDADAVAACFTPDGRFDSAGSVFEGRDAIRANFNSLKGPARPVGRTMHYITNIRIDFDGDSDATTTGLLFSFVSARETPTPDPVHATRALTYESRCVKSAGTWRFSQLVLSFVFGDPYPTLLR